MKYGYIRVSTKEQKIERQEVAILQEGVLMNHIYVDRVSGKDFERKRYQKLLKKLEEGDELFIKSIDRLGRNYEEIIEQWNILTKVKNIHIIILDCPLLDTRNQANGITGKFIADLVLQILSYVAQVERENTRKRQMEGIKEAKKRGVQFGRTAMPLPDNFNQVAMQWKEGEIGLRQGARILEIDAHTFSRWLKKYGDEIFS
jgi:Site-specific recombinases, DNA invertase Pin homologs